MSHHLVPHEAALASQRRASHGAAGRGRRRHRADIGAPVCFEQPGIRRDDHLRNQCSFAGTHSKRYIPSPVDGRLGQARPAAAGGPRGHGRQGHLRLRPARGLGSVSTQGTHAGRASAPLCADATELRSPRFLSRSPVEPEVHHRRHRRLFQRRIRAARRCRGRWRRCIARGGRGRDDGTGKRRT